MAERIIVEKTLDQWTESEKYYDYLGQMFKKSLSDLGWTLDKTPFELAEAAVFAGLAKAMMDLDPSGSIKQHVENFINDMDKSQGKGHYNVHIFPLNDGDIMYGPDEDGYYFTRWFGENDLVQFYLEDGRKITVGSFGTEFEQFTEPGSDPWTHTQIYSVWIVDGEKKTDQFYGLFSKRIDPPVDDYRGINYWMLKKNRSSYSIEYSASYRIINPSFEGSVTRTVSVGTFGVNEQTVDLEFNYNAPQIQIKSHIGDDIKYVQSITGGNGADAGLQKPTTQMLGQGGNGGHGGGGAGAGGTCKMETIYSTGVAVIDTSQTVWSMVNGSPGLGSSGTPGRDGGCIIYF